MSITRVSYGRTINVGKFESVRVELTAEVGPDEKWQEVLEDLRNKLLREEKKVKRQGF